eukprot:COSAG04_NODE_973_length_9084_cov_7.608792_8_plen_100_part_00
MKYVSPFAPGEVMSSRPATESSSASAVSWPPVRPEKSRTTVSAITAAGQAHVLGQSTVTSFGAPSALGPSGSACVRPDGSPCQHRSARLVRAPARARIK